MYEAPFKSKVQKLIYSLIQKLFFEHLYKHEALGIQLLTSQIYGHMKFTLHTGWGWK